MQALAADPEWLKYVRDPAWQPFGYDGAAGALTFVRLPRDAQRRAVFLDERYVAKARQSLPIRTQDLPSAEIDARSGPMHFIFHTAFCCSTLLARALDLPGISMGIKEPAVLMSFAHLWTGARQRPGAQHALGLTLDLLSRPLAPGETQVVKASNVANHIIPNLLDARADAKAILMHSSLDVFLAAIARRGVAGGGFVRRVFQCFAKTIPLNSAFSDEEFMLLTDLQVAAYVWLMQTAFLDSVARSYGPGRIRILDSRSFIANPVATLAKVGDFFDLRASREAWSAIAAGPVFNKHAKHHDRSFDAAAYQAQRLQTGAVATNEMRWVSDWGTAIARRCNAPLDLGDTLAG